jgi:ATP-binding cassette subfamily F protein 3
MVFFPFNAYKFKRSFFLRGRLPTVFLFGKVDDTMTIAIKAKHIRKEFGGKTVLEPMSIEVAIGERLALFGRNGVGKTTLLSILAGKTLPDEGTIDRRIPLQEWGWMEQQVELKSSMTTLAYVQSGCPEHQEWKIRLRELEIQMKDASASDMERYLQAYQNAYERYLQLDGFEWEMQVEKRLVQLKLERELWDAPFEQLSGGQKTRAQLARLTLQQPKLLLLDEPTNHLDEETLDWLEEWVCSYPGTIIFVSHDRYFIDRVATSLFEMTPSGGRAYKGGYSDYMRQKELEARTQEALYRKQTQMREQLEECIRNYQQWFHQGEKNARQAEVPIQRGYFQGRAGKHITRYRNKVKALERLDAESVDKPRDTPQLKMQLGAGDFAAHTLARMDRVSFGYGNGTLLLQDVTMHIERKDKLAVLGANGVGKTTLLKLLIGKYEPKLGSVSLHHAAKIGYFSQELEDLAERETILDSLLTLPAMTQTLARTILGCFLFSGEDVKKKIGDLSMGEKCRIAFLRLYFSEANLLVLDEPTNYLDIDTRVRIEQALELYPGALVLVSHDRFLIRKLATKLLLLSSHDKAFHFDGTLAEYKELEHHRGLNSSQLEQANVKRQLELSLIRLMGETVTDPAAQELHIQQIRSLKSQISQLEL